MKKIFKGLHQLYRTDPLNADHLLWGRKASPGRRGFIRKSALVALEMVIGANLVFADRFPQGMIPALLADSPHPFQIPGKHPGLVVLNDRPLNAETPADLLDPDATPSDRFFIRNNGLPPERSTIKTSSWTLTVDGEAVVRQVVLNLQDLQRQFEVVSYHLTLECGGNGRSEFNPPASGNQWTTGAVGCAKFTGVRLKDVLQAAGLTERAVYIGYYGADGHLSGNPEQQPISRGVPMAKAMEMESLIAWNMNDEPLPYQNGYPLRLVFGGWPASCSGKWLQRISVRDRIHDGNKMGGSSYRIPCNPVAPGALVPEEDMCIIESMPVKSLITYPKTGVILPLGKKLAFRGHAWAGDHQVVGVEFSIDFGMTWEPCSVEPPVNRLAWQRFRGEVNFPRKGYYELWARATDSQGKSQPMILPGWNPKGYLNNACHRIAVKVS